MAKFSQQNTQPTTCLTAFSVNSESSIFEQRNEIEVVFKEIEYIYTSSWKYSIITKLHFSFSLCLLCENAVALISPFSFHFRPCLQRSLLLAFCTFLLVITAFLGFGFFCLFCFVLFFMLDWHYLISMVKKELLFVPWVFCFSQWCQLLFLILGQKEKACEWGILIRRLALSRNFLKCQAFGSELSRNLARNVDSLVLTFFLLTTEWIILKILFIYF